MFSGTEDKMVRIKLPDMPIGNFDDLSFAESFKNYFPEAANCDEIDEKTYSSLSRDFSSEDVELILEGMGMEKYVELFKKENVSLDTFFHLCESDLEELGITDSKDRKTILKNLGGQGIEKKPLVVLEDHYEDLKIARNVLNQVLLLQNYCAYVEIQMKRNVWLDYKVSTNETASLYLKVFAEAALLQSQLMKDRIFNENGSHHLIGTILEVDNLKLPESIYEKLYGKKRKRKTFLLRAIAVIGLTSLTVLTAKYILRR